MTLWVVHVDFESRQGLRAETLAVYIIIKNCIISGSDEGLQAETLAVNINY